MMSPSSGSQHDDRDALQRGRASGSPPPCGRVGSGRADGVTALAVTMHESHIAWASFEMTL